MSVPVKQLEEGGCGSGQLKEFGYQRYPAVFLTVGVWSSEGLGTCWLFINI